MLDTWIKLHRHPLSSVLVVSFFSTLHCFCDEKAPVEYTHIKNFFLRSVKYFFIQKQNKKNQMGMSHLKTFCPFIPYIGQVLKEKLLTMMPQRSYDLKTKYGILKMMPPTPLYFKN